MRWMAQNKFTAVGRVQFGPSKGLTSINQSTGNVSGIAELIFGQYVWAFEITSALLITAALGAMVLAHRERLGVRPSQRMWAERRIRENRNVSGLPVPGVYARHNAVDTPALLPDGTASEASVSRVLAARGTVRSAPRDVDAVQRSIDYHPDGTPVSEASPEGRTGAVDRGPGSSSGPDLSPETPEGGA